ncbi:unnamed protein product [marine sediment metagenome]|uniref:Glycosyl transferase family 1 domain-containing protein n=1 Tax=marine sediment metagenome TaxID=412755 RepID=X1R476_9ZZZZ
MSLKEWDRLGMLNREMRLYECLVDRGIEIGFFTYGDESDFYYQDRFPKIKIIPAWQKNDKIPSLKKDFLFSWVLPWKYRKELATFDLFKTNQMWGSWVPLLTRMLEKKPILVRCGYEAYKFSQDGNDTLLMKKLLYWLSRWAYSSADAVALTTKESACFAHSVFKLPINKIIIQPNYVDTDVFKPLTPDKYYPKKILFVGRLVEQKNLFSLLKAVSYTKIGVDIIGHGPLKKKLERYAENHRVNVRFLGTIPNIKIPKVMARYPIYILPSFYEGHPKTLLEAMSCQMAVIGTKVTGIKEVIDDNVNGLLCEPTFNGLKSSIKRLINDQYLQKKIRSKAREFIKKTFSLEKIVENEIKIYRDILNKAIR